MEVIAILLVIFIVGVSVVVFISTSGIVPRNRIHTRPRKIVNFLISIGAQDRQANGDLIPNPSFQQYYSSHQWHLS